MSSYRIVVVGATSAGKSGITERYVLGTFVSEYGPTIDEIYQKRIEIQAKMRSLDIIDVSGLEEYHRIAEEHMTVGDGFIISYCINSRTSFTHVSKVRSALLRVKNNVPDIPIILTGNKSDLDSERTVTTLEGRKLAEEWDCPFFETSAKEDKNVTEVFTEIVLRIDAFRDRHPPVPVEAPKKTRATSRSWRKSMGSPKLNSSSELRSSKHNLPPSAGGEVKERGACVLL